MRRLLLMIMVSAMPLSSAGGALAQQPGQFTNGGIRVPWKFETHPLSVELTIRAAGGTMLAIACVPASRGAHVNQVFLKHMKDRPFATVASLELQINKRVFKMASDGVDRGIILNNTTKDGLAAVSDPHHRLTHQVDPSGSVFAWAVKQGTGILSVVERRTSSKLCEGMQIASLLASR